MRNTILVAVVIGLELIACSISLPNARGASVPRSEKWGIYSLDLGTKEVDLVFSSPQQISTLRLNPAGNTFAYSQPVGGDAHEYDEIFTLDIDGRNLQQLTGNNHWDIYPAWSPDNMQIAFLSFREADLDIYYMGSDGNNQTLLFDSGGHDADIHWLGNQIAFTAESRIWIMNSDGSNVHAISDPPRAGEWGNANLPFGDYDPRISPDGTRIVFERLVDDRSEHGNYDLYLLNIDGTNLVPLTNNGYSQGLASWSHKGDRIVYSVAAIRAEGKYDIYLMNADGSDNRNITPNYFPADFLCHSPIFSRDDSKIFFIGEWWQ